MINNTTWPIHTISVYFLDHLIGAWCISYLYSACMSLNFPYIALTSLYQYHATAAAAV